MIRLIALFVLLSGLAACATSEPQAGTQIAGLNVAPTAVAPQSVTENAESGDSIDIVVVPTAAQKGKNPTRKENYIVCKEELILGSHRKEEVCRYKSEIEAERKATQRELRRASMRPRSNHF